MLSPSGKIIARALQVYGAFCGDYAGGNVIYADNSPEAMRAWAGILRPDELEDVFTPAFIRAHFRVVEMGNILPGQNCDVPPPYVIDFRVSSPATSARIDFVAREIRLAVPAGTDPRRLVPGFTLFPAGSRLSINGVALASGRSILDLSRPLRARLTAPDGRSSDWTISLEF